jgi:hypothetical protein
MLKSEGCHQAVVVEVLTADLSGDRKIVDDTVMLASKSG